MAKLTRKKSAAPIYYSIADIAGLLGWQYKRTLRWLRRENAIVTRAGRLVTTRELLIRSFPEVWYKLAEDVGDL